MKPYYTDDTVTVWAGDCLDVLRTLPDVSVDSVVTDPPYSLAFMSRAWDSHLSPAAFQAWCQLWAAECLRVLKPGGHMLAFGGTRTYHRLACAIEDAGFEIRDSIAYFHNKPVSGLEAAASLGGDATEADSSGPLAWVYGSGFPPLKSMDVSRAIDKAAGAERTEPAGVKPGHEKFVGRDNLKSLRDSGVLSGEGGYSRPWMRDPEKVEAAHHVLAPITDDARTWQGWGTALKPAHEPVVCARKPLDGTVAANVLRHGTGALNIDACRIHTGGEAWDGNEANAHEDYSGKAFGSFARQYAKPSNPAGRWPANVVLDESQAAALDTMTGESTSPSKVTRGVTADPASNSPNPEPYEVPSYGDSGGASRFFYTAKASSSERTRVNGTAHATVKPLDLMRYLVRLVTPPGGTCLDPFAGSGTTVEACILEGFRCVAIEREPDYLPLITQRVHRRRDPAAYVEASGEDRGLFALLDEEPA